MVAMISVVFRFEAEGALRTKCIETEQKIVCSVGKLLSNCYSLLSVMLDQAVEPRSQIASFAPANADYDLLVA